MSRWSHRLARAALWGALLGGAASGAACSRIGRLVEQGRYDEAIAKAQAKRWPPKGAAARAYATALDETGRFEEARAVLYRDFLRGGELPSLVALADLEQREGRLGVAAAHYARVADLERRFLQEREDVCALLLQRASALARLGAGRAAEKDLSRVERLCGGPTDPEATQRWTAIATRAREAGDAEVDAEIGHALCEGDACDADDARARVDAVRADLAAAEASGPAAVRQVSARHGLSLSPVWVVQLLEADLRGELGWAVLGDDEVRRWLGGAGWSDLAVDVMGGEPGRAGYLQLRLQAVLPDMPVAPRPATGPDPADAWITRAVDEAGAAKWRVFAWRGDLASAELALGAAYRPKPGSAGAAATGSATAGSASASTPLSPATSATSSDSDPSSDSDSDAGSDSDSDAGSGSGSGSDAEVTTPPEGITVPLHWSARVEPKGEVLQAVLTAARLRYGRGYAEVALAIARYGLWRASSNDLESAVAAATEHAAWHLASGRPWHALAIADAVPGHRLDAVRGAAATALALSQAFCGGACMNDEDREVVTRLLGESWVAARQAEVTPRLATRRPPAGASPADPSGEGADADRPACPTVAERVAADDPLTRLAMRGDLTAPGVADALARAVEEDLTLSCAIEHALPLWAELSPSPAADALAERLSHTPEDVAPGFVHTHATLAMLAGRDRQAELLAIAAAGVSRDPASAWRALARGAWATGSGRLHRAALRNTLLHGDRNAAGVRRELLLAALSEVEDAWGMHATEAGREAVRGHVESFVRDEPPAARWGAREALARTIASRSLWTSASLETKTQLARALFSDDDPISAHPIAAVRLDLAEAAPRPSAFDPDSLELAVAAGLVDTLPVATQVLESPARLQSVHLAVARGHDDWATRWRSAVGLAVTGSAPLRVAALEVLLSMATLDQRRALLDWILAAPPVLEPSHEGGPYGAARLVQGDAVQLRLLAGLPVDPMWIPGPAAG